MKFKGLLFSIGVGAVIGLLCAPKKGSELRDDLKSAGKKAYNKLSNLTGDDIKMTFNEYYDRLEKEVKDLIDNDQSTEAKIDELKNSIDDLAKKALEKGNIDVNEIVERMNKIADDAANKVKEYKNELAENGTIADLQEKIDAIIEKEKEEINKILDEINKDQVEEKTEEPDKKEEE